MDPSCPFDIDQFFSFSTFEVEKDQSIAFESENGISVPTNDLQIEMAQIDFRGESDRHAKPTTEVSQFYHDTDEAGSVEGDRFDQSFYIGKEAPNSIMYSLQPYSSLLDLDKFSSSSKLEVEIDQSSDSTETENLEMELDRSEESMTDDSEISCDAVIKILAKYKLPIPLSQLKIVFRKKYGMPLSFLHIKFFINKICDEIEGHYDTILDFHDQFPAYRMIYYKVKSQECSYEFHIAYFEYGLSEFHILDIWMRKRINDQITCQAILFPNYDLNILTISKSDVDLLDIAKQISSSAKIPTGIYAKKLFIFLPKQHLTLQNQDDWLKFIANLDIFVHGEKILPFQKSIRQQRRSQQINEMKLSADIVKNSLAMRGFNVSALWTKISSVIAGDGQRLIYQSIDILMRCNEDLNSFYYKTDLPLNQNKRQPDQRLETNRQGEAIAELEKGDPKLVKYKIQKPKREYVKRSKRWKEIENSDRRYIINYALEKAKKDEKRRTS